MPDFEFMCPSTGQPCRYDNFCSIRKAVIERDAQGVKAGSIRQSLGLSIPSVILEAERSSFCSEESIKAIGAAAAQEVQDLGLDTAEAANIRTWGSAMASGILNARERWIAPLEA